MKNNILFLSLVALLGVWIANYQYFNYYLLKNKYYVDKVNFSNLINYQHEYINVVPTWYNILYIIILALLLSTAIITYKPMYNKFIDILIISSVFVFFYSIVIVFVINSSKQKAYVILLLPFLFSCNNNNKISTDDNKILIPKIDTTDIIVSPPVKDNLPDYWLTFYIFGDLYGDIDRDIRLSVDTLNIEYIDSFAVLNIYNIKGISYDIDNLIYLNNGIYDSLVSVYKNPNGFNVFVVDDNDPYEGLLGFTIMLTTYYDYYITDTNTYYNTCVISKKALSGFYDKGIYRNNKNTLVHEVTHMFAGVHTWEMPQIFKDSMGITNKVERNHRMNYVEYPHIITEKHKRYIKNFGDKYRYNRKSYNFDI